MPINALTSGHIFLGKFILCFVQFLVSILTKSFDKGGFYEVPKLIKYLNFFFFKHETFRRNM